MLTIHSASRFLCRHPVGTAVYPHMPILHVASALEELASVWAMHFYFCIFIFIFNFSHSLYLSSYSFIVVLIYVAYCVYCCFYHCIMYLSIQLQSCQSVSINLLTCLCVFKPPHELHTCINLILGFWGSFSGSKVPRNGTFSAQDADEPPCTI